MIYAPCAGVNHFDNSWVAPPERFTRNSVAWGYTDTCQGIHESILDTAEAEPLLPGAAVRPRAIQIRPVLELPVAQPKEARSVQAGKPVAAEFEDGVLTLTTNLEGADQILLPK